MKKLYQLWEENFPSGSTLTKFVHLICIGKEDFRHHLAGITYFSAHEVVLMSSRNKKSDEMLEKLVASGVAARRVSVDSDYAAVFGKASEEVNGLMNNDMCVAVNVGTGPRIMVAAVEDAVRVQLKGFYSQSDYREGPSCSAFRYSVEDSSSNSGIRMAPIWNTNDPFHNTLISALLEHGDFISERGLWQLVSQLEEYDSGYESFRKLFRHFVRWIRNLPNFEQKFDRGQRFRINFD